MTAGMWGRRVAAVATIGMLAAGVLGGVSVAAPPDPGSTVLLSPPGENPSAVTVTDDAVYFVVYDGDYPGTVTTLYRRPVTTTVDGREIGPAEVIGRMIPETRFAEHEGTVAYVRAVDGRLVLRAPDGVETVPEWGDSPTMAAGVVSLSAEWMVVNDYPYDPAYTLVNRASGEQYPVADLVAPPAGYDWLADRLKIEVSDDRLVFGLYSMRPAAESTDTIDGTYTVELGPDGPVGDATVLQEFEDLAAVPGYGWTAPIGLDGDRVIWYEYQGTGNDGTLAVHWSEPPYTSTTTLNDVPGEPIGHDGSTVALGSPVGGTTTVTWVTPAGPDETLTLDVAGRAEGVHGTIVTVGVDTDTFLVDAAGDGLTLDPAATPPALPFPDARPGEGFTDEILWLFDHGLVGGYADGTFRPLASVNRDAMAAFLYRLANDGADAPDCTEAAFTDVPASHPFCGEITWLADTGITTGWADGTFRPATPVSREAMAAFLYRLTHDGADAPACTGAPFADVAVGQAFCGEIAWLADTGVTTGWPDGTFRPSAQIERQAMAAFLHRFATADLVPER